MNEFLGKLHECAIKFPMTDIWMDSCGEKELVYGLKRGITGATSNPGIVYSVVKEELDIWEPRIKDLVREMPEAGEEEIAWELIYEIGAQRSGKLLPVYRKYKGKKGRLSIQTNIKNYRSVDKMTEQACILASLGENMMVKLPASPAGIRVMDEATYRGISINATVSFTVAQAVAVAEAVEHGLSRRKAEGLDTDTMGPVCTLMIGRVDDWLKKYVNETGMIVDPEALEWAGVAVFKEAYRIYKKRGYTTRLLSAANRNHYHWSQLIGGDMAQTINYKWFRRLDASDIAVVSRIDEPVPEHYLKELEKIPEFHKAFDADGMKPEMFEKYGAFRDTLAGFIDDYENFCRLIRGYMI